MSRRMTNVLHVITFSLMLCLGGVDAALADPPAGAQGTSNDAQTPLPQASFMSSLKQAFTQNFDHEIIRGHFDLGSPPDVHRYYCLADVKTGRREPNGVAGQPVPRPDGMTGIKASAVSLYSCVSAEQQGLLVTNGYTGSNAGAGPGAGGNAGAMIPAASQPPRQPNALVQADVSPDRTDVAGVKLGMSPEEARAVLKSKKLLDYYEAMETLGNFDSTRGAVPAAGRFVNVVAAWTLPSAGDPAVQDGESYEIMFTPVPGAERVMAIVHSVAYSQANAVRETALADGLVKKYGGFTGSDDLPKSPTWRIQSGGSVQVGDACNRRGLFGGLSEWTVGDAPRRNLALKTGLDEFRFQIERCGIVIVTEDHATANESAGREERLVTRFTVTAYSPSIGFEGASAASQLIQTSRDAVNKGNPPRTMSVPTPDL